jgi:hypothetical protein
MFLMWYNLSITNIFLVKGRTEGSIKRTCKTASTVGTKRENSGGLLQITYYDEDVGRKPQFYVIIFHMCNIKMLTVPVCFIGIVKSSL